MPLTGGDQLLQELSTVRDRMTSMGADEEYKRTYFQQFIGQCEERRGSTCVRHRHVVRRLPPGLYCVEERTQCLKELRFRLQFVDAKMRMYKQQWDELKAEETGNGFLVSGGDEKRRKVCALA